jgi:apolipoprotein N-acyltransferase
MEYLVFALAGLCIAVSSRIPETSLAIFLLGVCSLCFAYGAQISKHPKRSLFLCGVLFHAAAFYWIPGTIALFGGFSPAGSYAVFALFAVTASVQFVVFGMLIRFFSVPLLRVAALEVPLAWMLTEHFFPRLFPWQLGHGLVGLTPISSLAEFVGVVPISGLLLWWSCVAVGALRRVVPMQTVAVMGVLTVLMCLVGYSSSTNLQRIIEKSEKISVALVQGNLSTDIKGNSAYFEANLQRYQQMSAEAVAAGAKYVFWPESVVNQWLPSQVRNVRGTDFDPAPQLAVPLVYGTLSYAMRSAEEIAELHRQFPGQERLVQELSVKKYNAAVGIDSQGEVRGRYYKRILMPFGEYLPLVDVFPWMREFSPQTGDFTSGELLDPIDFGGWNPDLRAGVLVCYEDLVPSLSREAALRGANLLVNLTNDAWYGKTSAPSQHHLLAQWRAIETRRFMLRVTNTGKTAVVDPHGKTVASLPIFVEDVLRHDIALLDELTLYARVGDRPLQVVFVVAGLLGILTRRKRQ